jgi:hypothetical protein
MDKISSHPTPPPRSQALPPPPPVFRTVRGILQHKPRDAFYNRLWIVLLNQVIKILYRACLYRYCPIYACAAVPVRIDMFMYKYSLAQAATRGVNRATPSHTEKRALHEEV